MLDSLDVFVVIERDDLIWIGTTGTNADALRLIRKYSVNAPGFFLVHSQKTHHRSFYVAGGGDDPLEVAKANLSFRPAC